VCPNPKGVQVPKISYRVTGKAGSLSYPPDRKAAAGDLVDDLPPDSAKWLLDSGYIERVELPERKRTAKRTAKAGNGEPSEGADGGDDE